MADQDTHSDNIDDYGNFDFSQLGDDEIMVSEQEYRSFPLTTIVQKNGTLDIEVYYEMQKWDYWYRNHSINELKKSFLKIFESLQIENIGLIEPGVFEEEEDIVLLTWHLKMPSTTKQNVIKTSILKSFDLVLYKTRLQLENNNLGNGLRYFFGVINENSLKLGLASILGLLTLVGGVAYTLGNIKYDADKIQLSDKNKALEDTIAVRENRITDMRHNSDSALNILSHMPYNEMTLDKPSFWKVQTTIENAGAVLYLNK